jgi:hypothetical protein
VVEPTGRESGTVYSVSTVLPLLMCPQAIQRAHRIGQDKPVRAIRFITEDSVSGLQV